MKIAIKPAIDKLCYYLFICAVALNTPGNYAAEEAIAGRVVAVNGQVSAVNSAGNTRTLARRSELFVGDTIVTAPASFAQVRMSDDAIISLKESTQFQIIAYSFEEPIQSNVSTMRLIEGGFRTITGRIGQGDRNAYTVETEFSAIGIRGTDHEAVIDNGLYTGVYQGGTLLQNAGGSLELGVGADYDFGRALDPNLPPEGLLLQPSVLGNIPVLVIPDLEESGTAEETEEEAPAALPASSATPTEITAQTGIDTTATSSRQTSDAVQINPNETNGDGKLACTLNSNNPACRPVPGQPPAEPEPEPEPAPAPEPEPAPAPEPEPAPAPEPEPAPAPEPEPAPAPEPEPAPAPEPEPAPAPEPEPAPAPEPTQEQLDVTWGAWDNPASGNWVVVEQADNSLVTLSTSDYLASINPTPVAALHGSAVYASGPASGFIGSGSAGEVTQVLAGLNVDFDSGAISEGRLRVTVGETQIWTLGFAGQLDAGVVTLNATAGELLQAGTVISDQIQADLGGVFTGSNADAFVGGFDLFDKLDAINEVNGLYTIER
jgi:hypothetical protein